MQNHHHQQQQKVSVQSTSAAVVGAITSANFTNTAKLPIETVKLLIASVSRRPNLWIRTSISQKRSDVNALWQQVSQEVHLPADICRIKWGHLRDNFRKVFIRNTISTEPPTTWRFYNDMRFMEAAVAENVMRQYRLREQSHYWQGLHSTEARQSSPTSSTTAFPDNCDRSTQNQFHFSELSSFFQNPEPVCNKRIKLENSESENSLHGVNQVTTPLITFLRNGNTCEKLGNNMHMGNNYNHRDIEDDDDDDQFDEDACSIEETYDIQIRNEKDPIDNTEVNIKNCNSIKEEIKVENKLTHHDELDSDRMFLLSLLPYLRKVSEQRKLQVRQKLQDVLIQELT